MVAKIEHWQHIPWSELLKTVRQMQAAIVKAEQAGDQNRVRQLQDQLVRSEAAKLLAVRQVTSTNGKRTPGIDGQLWDTPERKLAAARALDPERYQPQPARRVMIPKGHERLRPLGILTMRDRAMQALYLFALDPIAETRADPHSYGFRKYRATADAIARCAEIFNAEQCAWWILEADIAHCFDTISHEWLLRQIPLETEILRGWLTVGYLEQGQVYTPDRGLPQGGIISPTLANMTLDGLENLLTDVAARRRSKAVHLVRYADDFLVISSSKRLLRSHVQPRIEEFLKARGMRLAAEKTRITHLKHGVEFLGCHLCLRRGALRITPARANLQHVLQNIAATMQANPGASPTRLIQVLNPIIRGWVQYYKHLESRELFLELDRQVAQLLWKWAKDQHSGLLKHYRARQYFRPGPGGLRRFTDHEGQTLYGTRETPYVHYIPIDPACNPYDAQWAQYLKQRQADRKQEQASADEAP
jgi:RNA-directed DNA polymerase